MNLEASLIQLTSAYGPAGDESTIAALLAATMESYGDVTVDSMQNVICKIKGQGTHYLLDAHLDQIAFVVTGVDEKGFIKVAKSGGIDPRALLGHEVTVWGKEPLPGIISCQPPHLLKADSYETVPTFSDISIDIGLNCQQAKAVVSLGDRVTLRQQHTKLLNSRFSASFLDDRCGVAAILLALEQLKERRCPNPITVIFSSQEEVGTRGAAVAAFGQAADEAIAVDVSFAHTPDADAAHCGKLGDGPMIGVAPVLSGKIYKKLQKLAVQNQIPFQLEVMGETTGTNADVISVAGGGIPTGLLSVPQRYMHTPVETIDLQDVIYTAQLIVCYILEGDDGRDA